MPGLAEKIRAPAAAVRNIKNAAAGRKDPYLDAYFLERKREPVYTEATMQYGSIASFFLLIGR